MNELERLTFSLPNMEYYKNAIKIEKAINSTVDFMTNGETDDASIKLYGGKFGSDWDILNKLTLTFNSSIRINDSKAYKSDESDNDGDGKVDESGETGQ